MASRWQSALVTALLALLWGTTACLPLDADDPREIAAYEQELAEREQARREAAELAASGRAVGGSVHRLGAHSPGFGAGGPSDACLWYRARHDRYGVANLTGCTDEPNLSLVLDLEQGFARGWIQLRLYCPGSDLCRPDEVSESTVRGRFSTVAVTTQPEQPPPSYPFPDHHYHARSTDWAAAAPIELDLTAAGTYPRGDDDLATIDASATETGWVTVELSPLGSFGSETPPEGWMVWFSVVIDHPEDRDPLWHLDATFTFEIEEDGVLPPPRDGA